MNEELRAAAERLRKPYPRAAASSGHDWSGYYMPIQEMKDLAVLADAYLTEHPADDGEPVTEEWLRSMGFEWDERQYGFGVKIPGMELWIRVNGQMWMFQEGMLGGRVCPYKGIYLRGDVRRLAAALGVTLQDPGRAGEGER